MYTLGMDIGGTFTDFTLVDRESGNVTVDKSRRRRPIRQKER